MSESEMARRMRHEQEMLVGAELSERLERIEKAIRVMASWLVQAQTGFSAQDARGIEDILDGKSGL